MFVMRTMISVVSLYAAEMLSGCSILVVRVIVVALMVGLFH